MHMKTISAVAEKAAAAAAAAREAQCNCKPTRVRSSAGVVTAAAAGVAGTLHLVEPAAGGHTDGSAQ
jgi:hypothetical protein